MNDRVYGIVIKETDVKENDRIIQVYTEEFGCISLYGRGLRKITSKNAYACQLFDFSEFSFDWQPERDIQLMKSAVLKNEYLGIKSDYERLVLASLITEIANIVADENIYELLYTALEHLDTSSEPYTVFNIFIVRILDLLGLNPEVDRCVVCGDTSSIETISLADGGFLCRSCNSTTHLKPVDVDFMKRFRITCKASYEVLEKIMGLKLNDYRLTDLLVEFLVTHSGINLRSWRSLKSLHE